MNKVKEVIKGEVYFADIPYISNSSIQSGIRPVIIMCNKMAGIYSPVIQYIPVTSRTEKMKRKQLPTHVLLDSKCPNKDSVALAEQLGCIDKNRLMEKICVLSKNDMLKIDRASDIQIDTIENESYDNIRFAYA